MKVVRSDQHKLHFPRGELYGGELVRPFECPERWDYIMQRLQQQGFDEYVDPQPLDMRVLKKVHADDFLEFLEQAWSLWQAEDYAGDAIASVFPARRMRQKVPQHIDGKLGYYCMAIETAITSGTWQAACSSAACAGVCATATCSNPCTMTSSRSYCAASGDPRMSLPSWSA